jgi:tRNA(Ile)-lysidine synthase
VRETGAHVLVALSGGCDSVVLLHLLRFHAADPTLRVSAAHYDHAMRPESDRDACWVRGLCAAWGVPLVAERADRAPAGERAAREARYRFLLRALRESGATLLATAHHADDQAETVLFRVLRGTGVRGLAGIPALRADGVVRPLLPFWRGEIRRYARARALRWRPDPTNRSVHPARNRIRLELLPAAERHVARGARRNLVRLAALAAEEEQAWEALAARALAACAREEPDGAYVLVRDRLRGYDSPVAARALRTLLRRLGTVLDRSGTRLALEFIRTAPSGRRLALPGGVTIATEFGVARLERVPGGAAAETSVDSPLEIPASEPRGSGEARLGGRTVTVRWCTEGEPPADEPDARASFAADRLRFPLTVRARAPGDRIRTRGGRRSLKRLFIDARVPARERGATPVVVDADGAVVWVPGIATAAGAEPGPGESSITLTMTDV